MLIPLAIDEIEKQKIRPQPNSSPQSERLGEKEGKGHHSKLKKVEEERRRNPTSPLLQFSRRFNDIEEKRKRKEKKRGGEGFYGHCVDAGGKKKGKEGGKEKAAELRRPSIFSRGGEWTGKKRREKKKRVGDGHANLTARP